jgi:hypothetical protein
VIAAVECLDCHKIVTDCNCHRVPLITSHASREDGSQVHLDSTNDESVWDEVMVDEEGEDEWCWEKDFELTDDAVILPPIEQASVTMFFVCASGSSGTACSLQGWEPLSELRPHQVCTLTDCHG